MMMNKIQEDTLVVSEILPVTATGSVALSPAISLSAASGRHFNAYVLGGVRANSATLDGGWYWSATSGGSYVAITGTALTTDSASSLVHQSEVSTEQALAFAPTATYIKFGVTLGVGASPYAALVVARDSTYQPVSLTAGSGGASARLGQSVSGPVSNVQ